MTKKTPETLTWAESEKLLHTLRSNEKDSDNYSTRLRNYTMALIMLDAGLRVGELINLRISQLIISEEPTKSLQIETANTKSKVGRLIPLSNKIQNALQNMYNDSWNHWFGPCIGYAFKKPTSESPLTARQVQRIIENAGIKAIGRKVHPHILRHTFATRMMQITTMRVVQELLGHENLSSTQIYTHPNGDDLRKAIDGLDQTSYPEAR